MRLNFTLFEAKICDAAPPLGKSLAAPLPTVEEIAIEMVLLSSSFVHYNSILSFTFNY